MNFKKLLAILLSICCIACVLSGCGLVTMTDPETPEFSDKDDEGREDLEDLETNLDGDKVIPEINYDDVIGQSTDAADDNGFNQDDYDTSDSISGIISDDTSDIISDGTSGIVSDGTSDIPQIDIDIETTVNGTQNNGSFNEETDVFTQATENVTDKEIETSNGGQINNGNFEGTTTTSDFTVTYVSGTKNAYTYNDTTKVLTFTELSADSVYAISGKLNGNIVINAGDTYKLDLELTDFSLKSTTANPIFVNSGSEIKITAKKDTKNYIYDERAVVDTTQTGVYGGAIHSLVDLEICGKGELFVKSSNNNGIQTKKDLQVKNLALTVECIDNALKGNDSVTIENCATLLVAKAGDAIKTEATNLSSTTNKQRGTITILGGTHNIYAANDGIEASFDVIINNGSYVDETTQQTQSVATIINVYTDEYSNYTSGHSSSSSDSSSSETAEKLYVCYPSNAYKYSIKFQNDDATKSEWVNGTLDKSYAGGRNTTYYVYAFDKKTEYTKMQLFIYESSQTQQNESDYYARTDVVTLKDGSDTYRYSNSRRTWSWTNYDSLESSGGMGGGNMGGGGNTGVSLAYSAKGIKAGNSITINAGTITIKAVDDAIHADNTTVLESGATPTGNVTINGGTITLTSKDDGIHADGALTVKNGTVKVLTAYEGLEGNTISVSGGSISVTSIDDGFNSVAASGTGITISGGKIYVYAGGDGIDSNSRESKNAIAFTGGNTVIISTSGGNSAIDSDGGYRFSGGKVIAIMPNGGMTSESTNCSNFSSIGTKTSVSLSAGAYATVKVSNSTVASVKMPKALSAVAIYLGSSSATISSATSSAGTADANGVYWAA